MADLMSRRDARIAYNEGRPFRVRLEFVGRNADNLSGRSRKFWECVSQGRFGDNDVTIRYGRIGAEGRTIFKPISYYFTKVWEKLDKGYVDAAAPYGSRA